MENDFHSHFESICWNVISKPVQARARDGMDLLEAVVHLLPDYFRE